MERNKSDEYTFGVDEKETLDKLNLVESSVEKNSSFTIKIEISNW